MNIYYSKKYSEKENNTTLIQNGLSYSTSLLKRVLELIGCKGELKRNSHDKPYIAGIPGLNISVTHTGNLWVCVADIEAVGIDAEYYDRRIGNMERLAKRFFTQAEYDFIQSIEDIEGQKYSFLRLWTMKEAVLKLRGTGIAGRLDSVELVKDGKLVCLTEGLYFYALSMLDGLCLTVCSRRNMTNVSDTYVELPFLSDVKFLEIEN